MREVRRHDVPSDNEKRWTRHPELANSRSGKFLVADRGKLRWYPKRAKSASGKEFRNVIVSVPRVGTMPLPADRAKGHT